jgi:transcription-repair coupling factor (superfamily II helicase)
MKVFVRISEISKMMTRLIGVGETTQAIVAEDWIRNEKAPIWILITNSIKEAEQLTEDIGFFHQGNATPKITVKCLYYPEIPEDSANTSDRFEAASDRLTVLCDLHRHVTEHNTNDKLVVTATLQALLQPVPQLESLQNKNISLKKGTQYGHSKLVEALHSIEYDYEGLCEAPGQFAVRGGIIDLYPVTANEPYRIDFFGDEIESISTFDPVTQRSKKRVKEIQLTPSPSLELSSSRKGFSEYLGETVNWLFIEPEAIEQTLEESPSPLNTSWQTLIENRQSCTDRWFTISDLDLETLVDDNTPETITYDAESLSLYRSYPDESKLADERLIDEQSARSRFLKELHQWHLDGFQVLFILPSKGECDRAKELLAEEHIFTKATPNFLIGNTNEGFRIQFRKSLGRLRQPSLKKASGLVVVTETELFGYRRRRQTQLRSKALVNQSQVDQLLDFSEIVEGEFVVHLQHGIAVFRGITKIEMSGQVREVLSLEFDKGVTLHVPLQESHLVSRYVGVAKIRPQLGKVGSGRWEKTRQAAERATLDYAAKLLEMQARRDLTPGFPFPKDTQWQQEFEASFPYRETPDQLTAINETKEDMEIDTPMDRLICGDVGFGKTEVALRAAFKAVMGGKQVALLVPTTVLAQQHFNTFRERFGAFPVVVEVISRFRSRHNQKKILHALAEGKVDILIGTHRLIQKDVHFPNLGLVILDEEQRFGVKHKETFKEWSTSVDVLSMSATPIPRTLYMALTGARNLSVIETPPAARRPVKTIIKNYDDALVTEVIQKEIRRGGQVFYLHNRVQTIDNVAARLRKLVPEASICIGHGQMKEKDLEQIMLEFINNRYQVLVCTTIIESGIDLPNCNTIIIESADRFGLSQLYQLRGRVGRFKHQAYAYLLLHRHARLLDIARKRLHAIRQHNQLGAGFRIAMRDLELRGAGNLLGAQQSGHIVGVGFELYCQLIRQSIARLKGETSAETIRASVKIDFIYQGEGKSGSSQGYQTGYTVLKNEELDQNTCPPLEARISTNYIKETRLRIDFYRKLAMSASLPEIEQLALDLKDRFGLLPEQVKALISITEIRCLAEQKNVLVVETEGNRLKCRRNSPKDDDYIMLGNRFPRLTAKQPLLRLNEIIIFLQNLPNR